MRICLGETIFLIWGKFGEKISIFLKIFLIFVSEQEIENNNCFGVTLRE